MNAPFRLRTRHWDDAIAKLDAERDAEEICRILANHVFPLEVLASLEIAQLRTFTIPTISAILHSTGHYEREGLRRLDDTRAILGEIVRPGLDSEDSRRMVEHLNDIHSLFRISNDDYLYTLSTFVFDPAIFIEKWGHRPLTVHEQNAMFFLYKKLGSRMKIRDLPTSREAFLSWRGAYEARAQRYSPDNEAVARGMLRAVGGMFPRVMRRLWEPLIVYLTDDRAFQAALGLGHPKRLFRWALGIAVRAYRSVSRRLNAFERAPFWETTFFKRFPTYPNGYDPLRLGPTKVTALLERRRDAPPGRRAATDEASGLQRGDWIDGDLN